MNLICRVAEVNRSSYYAWLKRPVSKTAAANLQLVPKLKALHCESRGTYGAPRLTKQLNAQGYACSQKRVARLMKKVGIFGCAMRRFRPASEAYTPHNLPVSPRLFEVTQQTILPEAPNQIWVGDQTYIKTGEGWLYLTVVMDVFSRKVVGYCMSDHLRAEAVWEAMKLGIIQQKQALSKETPELIFHSDRGGQYASHYYRAKLNLFGITQSMSRSGNCYDNAFAESFFHTLKVELIHRHDFKTRLEAQEQIQKYIDGWYNCKRLHSGLGYQAPFDYEQKALAA